jgi:hypothetical protein
MNQVQKEQTPALREMEFHFIKSTDFRVIHATGVWFGGDGQKNIHFTFYNERTPIPTKIVMLLDEKGHLVREEESKRESKAGMVRQMETDVVLSFENALSLYKGLEVNLRAVGLIE